MSVEEVESSDDPGPTDDLGPTPKSARPYISVNRALAEAVGATRRLPEDGQWHVLCWFPTAKPIRDEVVWVLERDFARDGIIFEYRHLAGDGMKYGYEAWGKRV